MGKVVRKKSEFPVRKKLFNLTPGALFADGLIVALAWLLLTGHWPYAILCFALWLGTVITVRLIRRGPSGKKK
jgi:hypothetical protein